MYGLARICCFALLVTWPLATGSGQEGIERTELNRAVLTGAEGTEVITARISAEPGASMPRHKHPGDEYLYVLDGGAIQALGEEPRILQTGDNLHFPRGMVHGGFSVVGDSPITVLTVHIVDKGKPLVELAD